MLVQERVDEAPGRSGCYDLPQRLRRHQSSHLGALKSSAEGERGDSGVELERGETGGNMGGGSGSLV